MNWLEQAAAEAAETERQEAEIAAQVSDHNRRFEERWPHYCRVCGGWGQSHPCGMDPCEAPDDPRTCHRCAAPGLTEDGEGPCSACGWNYDDGLQEP